MENNNQQNAIQAQEAMYLGYIEDPDNFQRSAVVKLPQFDKPVVVFSPSLTLMDIGELAYSKDHPEEVGSRTSVLSLIDPSGDTPSLKSGDKVAVYFRTGWWPVSLIPDGSPKNKGIFISDEPSSWFEDGATFQPLSLEDMHLLPHQWITMSGQVTSEDKTNFVVDATMLVLLPNNLKDDQGEKLKIGDWVEGRIGQIYFLGKDEKIN